MMNTDFMAFDSTDKTTTATTNPDDYRTTETCVSVTPGICGFDCLITARRLNKKTVALIIAESECKQIQRLAKHLGKLTLKELFIPVTRNPVYLSAEQSGCHPSCPIPTAALKAAEVALEMALPRNVLIQFEACKGDKD
jgi:hypothetical protein